MSCRCGPNCYRKRGMRSQCPSCNRYNESRRKTITAGGKRRYISFHRKTNPHVEVSNQDIAYVLDNWRIRGVATDEQNRQSMAHYAFVPGQGKVVRVAVSMDGKRFITAFIDSDATKYWHQGTQAYFSGKIANMEVR